MQKRLSLLFLALCLSTQTMANIYPDPKEPNVSTFIRVTKNGDNYSFAQCQIKDKNNCQQIGEKNTYSKTELEGKVRTLKDRGAMSNLGALVTGGLTLLLSARLYLMRKAISPKELDRDLTLSYTLNEKGEASGTLAQHLDRLVRALKVPVTATSSANESH